jgi:hypothetical protein
MATRAGIDPSAQLFVFRFGLRSSRSFSSAVATISSSPAGKSEFAEESRPAVVQDHSADFARSCARERQPARRHLVQHRTDAE